MGSSSLNYFSSEITGWQLFFRTQIQSQRTHKSKNLLSLGYETWRTVKLHTTSVRNSDFIAVECGSETRGFCIAAEFGSIIFPRMYWAHVLMLLKPCGLYTGAVLPACGVHGNLHPSPPPTADGSFVSETRSRKIWLPEEVRSETASTVLLLLQFITKLRPKPLHADTFCCSAASLFFRPPKPKAFFFQPSTYFCSAHPLGPPKK